ncbi:amino acid ABC transporter ATP-binding protein [Ornithinimicrobium cavernae]|uniref:amino acid ABC transporter ATP-binding protein n=1 Tax=Ornithinimicrobium cavernae TaxID=2666047 RepID=UPI000D69940A|nr:amino acid ABC transporter ATP-binding protein [Ornithinimicrobium cavernae]
MREKTTEPLVRIRGVHKSFGSLEVLKGIDLDVDQGEVCVLLGRSGSGKSTLLRCINHLEGLNDGEIHVGGERIGYERRRDHLLPMTSRQAARQRQNIGMVFQRFNLFAHRTVLENVMEAPIYVAKRPRKEVKREALELLERVGLADKPAAYPAMLSGGQQQRVAIARALAMHPALMLFDEPTSALDPELVGEVLTVIQDLARSGMTMIVVTHEISFAREVADTAVFMDGGLVVEKGPPSEILSDPSDPRTRTFLSRVLKETA